jgi:hypothetical protein
VGVLVSQLLASTDPELAGLPARWLAHLLEAVGAAGCSVNEMHRRSTGLPFAFLALFMAEPSSCPKVLLPAAMDALLAVAAGEAPGLDYTEANPRVHAFNCLR